MEKPPLEKIIEKLEKLDIQEWSTSPYLKDMPGLTAKTNGLVIDVKPYYKEKLNPFAEELWYCIFLQDENQKLFIEYRDHAKKGGIHKFYEKLCRKLEDFSVSEFEKRVQDFIYSLEPEKKDIEKLIKKLENIDSKEWEINLNLGEKKHNPKYPKFTLIHYGLKFSLKKGIWGDYSLKIQNLEDGRNKIVYGQDWDAKTRFTQRELIKHLYEKLCKEIEHKEKGFKEKLDNFLSD